MSAEIFSIIIPTWNNLPYLKLCLSSLHKNSGLFNQIVLHINDGSDGTLEWVKDSGITYSHSKENIGICSGLNQAAKLATNDHLIYINDDMYVLPGWDQHLDNEIKSLNDDLYLLSGTMIEPRNTGNKSIIVEDYGDTLDNFREEDLLENFEKQHKTDWQGSTWPPVVIAKKYWDQVGGLSEEFSPGMYSDPDLSMKMWQLGCRLFKGIGKSRVYHFQQKSTKKMVQNNGRKTFLKKWGINNSTFQKYYLRMGQEFDGPLSEPKKNLNLSLEMLRAKIKKAIW